MQIKKALYYRLLLIACSLAPMVLFGQSTEDYPKTVGFGVKGGVTNSLLNVGIPLPLQQINSTFVPSYGIIFSRIDKKTVGFQLEINYVTKSWEENPVSDYLFNATLNYIEIPMLTTLHFGNRFKFLVNFGPYLSILLNEESSNAIAPESDYSPYYENRSPRKGDFGMIGGAGFRLETKLGLFQLEARYTYGFQNLYDSVDNQLEYSNFATMGVFLSYQILFFNGQ